MRTPGRQDERVLPSLLKLVPPAPTPDRYGPDVAIVPPRSRKLPATQRHIRDTTSEREWLGR
jgi:hypothetical protein